MKRVTRYFILLLVLGGVGAAAYVYFQKPGNLEVFRMVPKDAVFVIESSDMIKGWESLSSSNMWQHLMSENTYYEDLNRSAFKLDSLISGNKMLTSAFKGKQIIISAHIISQNDYDFLFIINTGNFSKLSFLQNYLIELAQLADYTTERITIEGTLVHLLTDKGTNDKIYLCFKENLLAVSYNRDIMLASIKQSYSDESIVHLPDFALVNSSLSSKRLFNFYFNFEKSYDFARIYTSAPGESVKSLSEALLFSAFNVNIESETIRLEGYTAVSDSSLSYLNALAGVSPGRQRAHELVSDKAAIMISMSFDTYAEFYEKLVSEFSRQDTARYDDINKTRRRIERFLSINLEEDFFGWIGSEVALVKLRPTSLIKEDDMLAYVHTNDIDKARQGLERISKQVRRRSPMRFDVLKYNGYEIHSLEMKGFFRLFFGKLFSGFDRPYFTYIDDYVVFANSTGILIQAIDDHIRANTLERNKSFSDFRSNFSNRANVSVYIMMPRLYSHIFYHSKAQKRDNIRKNRNLILSFSHIGFQMVSEKNMFKTSLFALHDEDAPFDDELERIELAADELQNLYYESLSFNIELSPEAAMSSSHTRINYPDTNLLWGEGMVRRKKPDGMWRLYYQSGNLKGIVNYNGGKVDGQATFFYDNDSQVRKAEMQFNNDQIDGSYHEFYSSGTRKAMLNYRRGRTDGKAEFYYESGMLRMSGEYRRGNKSGKWIHYTESGLEFDREKWRRDKRKR